MHHQLQYENPLYFSLHIYVFSMILKVNSD
jgi:hypothetical protein